LLCGSQGFETGVVPFSLALFGDYQDFHFLFSCCLASDFGLLPSWTRSEPMALKSFLDYAGFEF
jgi:hypothetical protein